MKEETRLRKIMRDWPILRLYIEIPLFSVRTELMGYHYESEIYDYVSLEIRIWKWRTEFMLYKNRIW